MANSLCTECGVTLEDAKCTNELCPTTRKENHQSIEPDKTQKRPVAITGLCWLLLVGACLNLYATVRLFQDQRFLENLTSGDGSLRIQLGIAVLGLLILLVSSIAMLGQKNWGRWLLMTWFLLGIVGLVFTRQFNILTLLALLITALIAAVLFRRESNEYFVNAPG